MPDYLIYFLIGISLLLFLFRKQRPKIVPEAWLPQELKKAKIFSVEGKLSFHGKYNIQGKADRVYQLKTGELVPVERKNRGNNRVHSTDQLQLSLYSYMLRRNGEKTAPFGFVVFSGENFAHKVSLLSDEQVDMKLQRYENIKSEVETSKKRNDFRCQSCSHFSRCQIRPV